MLKRPNDAYKSYIKKIYYEKYRLMKLQTYCWQAFYNPRYNNTYDGTK